MNTQKNKEQSQSRPRKFNQISFIYNKKYF